MLVVGSQGIHNQSVPDILACKATPALAFLLPLVPRKQVGEILITNLRRKLAPVSISVSLCHRQSSIISSPNLNTSFINSSSRNNLFVLFSRTSEFSGLRLAVLLQSTSLHLPISKLQRLGSLELRQTIPYIH